MIARDHAAPALEARELLSEFASEVRSYLTITPRQLPSRHLYDGLGSALFEAICELPWYGITRAEGRLLVEHRDEVFARLSGLTRIVEFGPGSGHKLAALLGGAPRDTTGLTVHLIDMSEKALTTATRTLADVDNLTVTPHHRSFEAGLDVIGLFPPDTGRTLVLFLGSNIGNFDPPVCAAFLSRMRAALAGHDALLLGADLVKPERDLLLAYDDPLGVSAAFNKNLLVRLNRELGANFDLDAFDHRAVWNAALSRMEMYLVARRAQRVWIEGADLEIDLKADEAIWTESSYKYRTDEIGAFVEQAGFRALTRWIDEKDQFALMLFEAA